MFRKKQDDNELIISRPKPPVSTTLVVGLRTFCTMYLLMVAVLLHMVVMLRPWKQEWVGKPTVFFEISIWHVCRYTFKSIKCYDGELDNAPGWFLAFRWFLMLTVIFQYMSFLFILARITFTKNSSSRHFWVPAFVCLLSAIFILCSMLILIGYGELDFLETSRMYRMGWRFEEVRVEEQWAWPYYLTWCNFGICLIGFFVCMFTHVKDSNWSKHFAMENMRNKAKNMMR